MTTYKAMQVMQTLDVCGITSAICLADLHLVVAQPRLFCLFWRHNDAAIYTPSVSAAIEPLVPDSLQLTPSASHALSTSGLADCR